MATTIHQPGDEIVGGDIDRGHIIGVRDRSVFGYHTDQNLAIVVDFTIPVDNLIIHVYGTVLVADDTDVNEPTIITVAQAEPLVYYGAIDRPWNEHTADYVRRCVRQITRGEVNE